MSDPISIDKSIGSGAVNNDRDVQKFWAAMVAIGPDHGGIYAVPLAFADKKAAAENVAASIRSFQNAQTLPMTGQIKPGDRTLARLNEILNPGTAPSTNTGLLQPLVFPQQKISSGIHCPNLDSVQKDFAFSWHNPGGYGSIYYFELQEDVVPNWFGVVVPFGLTNLQHVHIFFHPTPGQAKDAHNHQIYVDANYPKKIGWESLFHYVRGPVATQFCAANTGQVMIMPMMNGGSAGNCGILPARWESIFGQMLARIQSGRLSTQTEPIRISGVVVSSFSSGIIYNYNFRQLAHLGSRLHGVLDMDGLYSTNRRLSILTGSPAVKIQQMPAAPKDVPRLAKQRVFPMSPDRFIGPTGPYTNEPFRTTALRMTGGQVHGAIPGFMMFLGAHLTRVLGT